VIWLFQKVGRSIVAVLLTVQLGTCCFGVIPSLYTHSTATLLQLFVVFLTLGMAVNWVHAMVFSSAYDAHDRKSDPRFQKDKSYEHDHKLKYCDVCQIYMPLRTHHCKLCNTCILKRDHHCYLTGNCIGFRNQRYFIIGAFYSGMLGSVCGVLSAQYVYHLLTTASASWLDLLLPVTLVKWIFGYISSFNFILILFCFIDLFFAAEGFRVFIVQIIMIYKGVTLFELKRFRPVRNLNNADRNFRSVFGAKWALNFLWPLPWKFPQEGDGHHWPGTQLDYLSQSRCKGKG